MNKETILGYIIYTVIILTIICIVISVVPRQKEPVTEYIPIVKTEYVILEKEVINTKWKTRTQTVTKPDGTKVEVKESEGTKNEIKETTSKGIQEVSIHVPKPQYSLSVSYLVDDLVPDYHNLGITASRHMVSNLWLEITVVPFRKQGMLGVRYEF